MDVPPHAAGELAGSHCGHLVAQITTVGAGEQVLGRGQGWAGDLGVIADVIEGSSRRVVVAEQTREDKPNISQLTSESSVSGETASELLKLWCLRQISKTAGPDSGTLYPARMVRWHGHLDFAHGSRPSNGSRRCTRSCSGAQVCRHLAQGLPRIFHDGCAARLNIAFELHKCWCAILGLK